MSTTTLPPLQPGGMSLTQRVLASIPRDKHLDTWNKPVKKRTIRQNSIPGEVVVPCQIDTAKYRNSFLHNVSVEMLTQVNSHPMDFFWVYPCRLLLTHLFYIDRLILTQS